MNETNWFAVVASLAEIAQMWDIKNRQSALYRLLSEERRAGNGAVYVYKSAGTWLVYLPAAYKIFGKPKYDRIMD